MSTSTRWLFDWLFDWLFRGESQIQSLSDCSIGKNSMIGQDSRPCPGESVAFCVIPHMSVVSCETKEQKCNLPQPKIEETEPNAAAQNQLG
jgi:hypothetical protein